MKRLLAFLSFALALGVFLRTSFADAGQRNQEAAWQIEVVDGEEDVGYYTSLALDSSNRPHISYWDDDSRQVRYAHWTGSYWDIDAVSDDCDLAKHISLALDSSNRPHVSYYREWAGDSLRYAHWTGNYWDIDTVDSGDEEVGIGLSLALDSSDVPHISYCDGTYGPWGNLKYAFLHCQEWADLCWWQRETVDSEGDVGGVDTSLVLDSSDQPHISYHDRANGDLKYVYLADNGWYSTTVDTLGDVGIYSSLALDEGGFPHISYYDMTNGNMEYAFFHCPERPDQCWWQTETVDSEGDVGRYTSLALDEGGYPHISYYDETNGNLKYAYEDTSGWHSEAVDTEGDVGRYTSLALDTAGNPHISYYDATNHDLKYALQSSTLGPTVYLPLLLKNH